MPTKSAFLELLWWQPSEDYIRWLHQQGNQFWDADAGENGWKGYKYCLLTHWPCQGDGYVDELERVLQQIRAGKANRNWCIKLLKPDEPTKLQSCIDGLQFCRRGTYIST